MSGSAFTISLTPAAARDRSDAERWWLENHGPVVPSRLQRELADAAALLVTSPKIGFGSSWRGRSVFKYRLACDFFIVYTVRPRRREVVILRILAASRLHG